MVALATVADVEAVTGSAIAAGDEPRVQLLLEFASEVVRAHTGQQFDAVATDEITVTPISGALRLPQRPVTAVSEVSVAGVVLDPSEYTWNSRGQLWRRVAGCDGGYRSVSTWGCSEVTVVYSHGYNTPPPWLVMIVAELAGIAWTVPVEGSTMQSESEQIGTYMHSATYRDSAAGMMVLSPLAIAILDRMTGTPIARTILLAPIL